MINSGTRRKRGRPAKNKEKNDLSNEILKQSEDEYSNSGRWKNNNQVSDEGMSISDNDGVIRTLRRSQRKMKEI